MGRDSVTLCVMRGIGWYYNGGDRCMPGGGSGVTAVSVTAGLSWEAGRVPRPDGEA